MAAEDRLDANSFTPLYHQLAQLLHTWIRKGELRPGERIPTEAELSERFDVSRVTVRRAIAILTESGLLQTRQGRGTFVVNPDLEGGIFVIPDFREDMLRQGISPQTRLLSVQVVNANARQAEKLGVKRGTRLLFVERLLEREGEPLILDRKYILSERSQPLLEAELGHGPVTELFAENPEMLPVRADLKLSVTSLDKQEAEVLRARRGAPAFCLEQVIFAANDVRVAWGWLIYRGDKFQFESLSRMV